MKKVLFNLTWILLVNSPWAQACSVCFFGDPTQQVNVALRWAIIVLLLILLGLMVLFIKFFISISQRSTTDISRKY